MVVETFLGIANNAISLVQKVCDVKGVKAKTDALEMSMGLLSAKKADISDQLEQEERKPGKKRKRQVHSWMDIVRLREDEVRELGRKVRERPFLSSLMLADRVRDLATQVEELQEKGRFDNGLTLDIKPARGYELQPGELVGQASQTKRDEIWDCLMNEEVLQVGVWGQAGAGKTFLGKHIHDQIVQHSSRFDGACWVTVSQEGTVLAIQTDIANYLELDLTKVSRAYWSARLKEALRGRRFLILDDVGKYYSLKSGYSPRKKWMQIDHDVAITGGVRANELPRACPCIISSRRDTSGLARRSIKLELEGAEEVGRGRSGSEEG